MTITVLGAGAFGTALAIAWAQAGKNVTLWGRDAAVMQKADASRQLPRLRTAQLPENIICTGDLAKAAENNIIALALPAQQLRVFLQNEAQALSGKTLIACCKGIDLSAMTGPVATITRSVPTCTPAILTGPSFAADIAKGLPTALTLACVDEATGKVLQQTLTTPTLRLYRTTDTLGAELGGALKNVMAIACGVAIGAGLGESARAALMTRGFAEMMTLADRLGAQADTLHGLSGFGDLVLTCTSSQSRNFRYGQALGSNNAFDATMTVEGAATARAVSHLASDLGLDLPISQGVAALINGETTVASALTALMSRPLKEE